MGELDDYNLNELENAIVNHLTETHKLMGLQEPEARTMAKNVISQIKEESHKEGTDKGFWAEANRGDKILQNKNYFKEFLDRRYMEGVKDSDIKWYWNMHDLELRMMVKIDDIFRLAATLKYQSEEKLSIEEAIKKTTKYFPYYDHSYEPVGCFIGDSRKLPQELRNRVEIWRQKQNVEELINEIDAFPSFNAIVREEMKKHNL